MDWVSQQTDRLSHAPICGYYTDLPPATEPTAWAALALAGAGRSEPVDQAANWLAELQADNGSVGISLAQATPQWPTSLAILVWLADGQRNWRAEIDAAADWILNSFARTYDFQSELVGHDTTIPAWSWVEDTHCWVEPTSLHVVALTALGLSDHRRTRDGIRMLLDRQLIGGGCNYGNTTVLGQRLMPHVMPTGYSLIALSTLQYQDARVAQSLGYLQEQIRKRPTCVSLSMAMMGLSAHGVPVEHRAKRLETALERSLKTRDSVYRRALALLAAQGEGNKVIQLMREGAS